MNSAYATLSTAIFNAVWACGHSITAERVLLHADSKPAGLNARAQLRARIETALFDTRGRHLQLSTIPDEAVVALEDAVLGCPHTIDAAKVRLGYADGAEGHNALNQLHRRIDAAVQKLAASQGALS